jgi:hypothetical protein
MIEHNGHLKSEYEELISEVKQDLKNQIKGQSPVANNV